MKIFQICITAFLLIVSTELSAHFSGVLSGGMAVKDNTDNMLSAGKANKKGDLTRFLYDSVKQYDATQPQHIVLIALILLKKADPNIRPDMHGLSAFEVAVLEKKDPSLIRLIFYGGGRITDDLLRRATGKPLSLLLDLNKTKRISVFESLQKEFGILTTAAMQRQEKEFTSSKNFILSTQNVLNKIESQLFKKEQAKSAFTNPIRIDFIQNGKLVAALRLNHGKLNGWSIFYQQSGEFAAAFLMKEHTITEAYLYKTSETKHLSREDAPLKLQKITSVFWKNFQQGKYKVRVSFALAVNHGVPKKKLLSKIKAERSFVLTATRKNGTPFLFYMIDISKLSGLRGLCDQRGYCYAETTYADGKYVIFFYSLFSGNASTSLLPWLKNQDNPFAFPEAVILAFDPQLRKVLNTTASSKQTPDHRKLRKQNDLKSTANSGSCKKNTTGKRPMKGPYYDADLGVVIPVNISGFKAIAFQEEAKNDPGYEICYVKDDYHADLYIGPATEMSLEQEIEKRKNKRSIHFKQLMALGITKKMPSFYMYPERKFFYANAFSYRTLTYKYDVEDKNNKKILKNLVEIFCRVQNKIIILSLFNNKEDKNNLSVLTQFAQTFGRKVLRNINNRLPQNPPARSGNIHNRSHYYKFQNIIEKQSYL